MAKLIAEKCPSCGKPRIAGRQCGHCGARLLILLITSCLLAACGDARPVPQSTREIFMNPVPQPFWPQPAGVYRAW